MTTRRGRLRFYYNTLAEQPLVASVDTGLGTPEIKLAEIVCYVPCWSVCSAVSGQPRFWMECDGQLRIENGTTGIIEAVAP